MSKKKIIILSITLLVFIIGIAVWIYLGDYYHAKDVEKYLVSDEQVKVKEISSGYFFDGPGEEAMIFYPGAKVEETAYAPLMYKLALNGVDCFLVHMPFRLAIFGINKADEIIKNYSYDKWYIGGHSLGGAMAANYAYDHSSQISKIFLLGSYSTKNLNSKNIDTYYIYGSNDKVLNKKKLNESKNMLDDNYIEYVIEGGNHAYFGSYGNQKGDGEAIITSDEQIDITVSKIIEYIEAQ